MKTWLEVAGDPEELAARALEYIIGVMRSASGIFRLSLAGGHTPRRLYGLLASEPTVEWERVELYLGDERYVPLTHKDSNFLMIRRALVEPLEQRGIKAKVYPWPIKETPQQSAADYDRILQGKSFDLTLLGLGEDGHTASLFPGTAALKVEDQRAVANFVPSKSSWRLTTTYPMLNSSAEVLFLVSGPAKAQALKKTLTGLDVPAAKVKGRKKTGFIVDKEAARLLDNHLVGF